MQSIILNRFKTFREKIFDCFSFRADATMELVDALSGNADASSVVQLTMNPAFRRKYGSIRDAITNFEVDQEQSSRIEGFLIKHCSAITETQPFRLMVLDCTPAPRKHAKTLKDRGIVHAPNVIPGNKPITVGHQYSVHIQGFPVLVILPGNKTSLIRVVDFVYFYRVLELYLYQDPELHLYQDPEV